MINFLWIFGFSIVAEGSSNPILVKIFEDKIYVIQPVSRCHRLLVNPALCIVKLSLIVVTLVRG